MKDFDLDKWACKADNKLDGIYLNGLIHGRIEGFNKAKELSNQEFLLKLGKIESKAKWALEYWRECQTAQAKDSLHSLLKIIDEAYSEIKQPQPKAEGSHD